VHWIDDFGNSAQAIDTAKRLVLNSGLQPFRS